MYSISSYVAREQFFQVLFHLLRIPREDSGLRVVQTAVVEDKKRVVDKLLKVFVLI